MTSARRTPAVERTTPAPRPWRRPLFGLNLLIFLVSIATILVVVNYFARRSEMRWTVDATKTRAYSLSPQSQQLLASLDGEWTIAMLLSHDTTDPATRRQIDEVLSRYERAAPNLHVQRIDPSDPSSLSAYEALIARLQVIYGDTIVDYDAALDMGEESFSEFMLFAQQYSAQLERLMDRLPRDGAEADKLRARTPLLAQIANQGQLVLDEVQKSRGVNDARPVPDYEGARSILATALWQWGNELADTGALFRQWSQRPELDPLVRQYVSRSWSEYEKQAEQMHRAADPLRRLPPMELSRIGTELQNGEAALVVGPDRATIIPAGQLLPMVSASNDVEGGIAFDRRFRGEQLISAAIRSLQLDHMPMVVFMHAEPQPLFARRDQQFDLVGAKLVLESSRFEVREWRVGSGEPPVAEPGQPVVWVVMPPQPSRSFRGMTPEEQKLVNEVALRIERGDSVLLNMYPNLLHRLGQKNPWEAVGALVGLQMDTTRAVYELVRTSDSEAQVQKWQWISTYDADHPIARAVNGRQTCFGATIGVRPVDPALSRMTVLAAIPPNDQAWLERDLLGADRVTEVPVDSVLVEPLPVVVASERRHPEGSSTQRIVAVGSGGWMMSNLADAVVSVGGERIALSNPGNYELMLASIAWLAHQDDLIAPSPISQEIARLTGVSDRARTMWSWMLLTGVPGLCLMFGIAMWSYRRM
ncbi:MAG: Gldg family protein [Phycisphaerales bacterium]|nr:Gldg family protein [Phycisphaerales bacterium]